ncbi:hypothetical protein JMJ56_24070 [Belnapia sp. T18]|uniref:Uncharacterized protein n=1 Tax=Belnapia arida TaxID=2804533 RepID=A0ABS1U8U0_9PROT|nr:hypothetical protein [Belnapia arida]MBL6081088.1 hypothetical protein [Belnapia arida]
MTEFVAERRGDLYALRTMRGLARVVIRTGRLKHRNLMPHALKYAAWAVRPGGRILVRDDAPDVYDLWPHFVSFKIMRQWTFKLLAPYAAPVRLDVASREIELERTAPPTPPGWGAGVVFSGRAEERPRLLACVESLLRQPELRPENGGEIVVSGPAAAADCVTGHRSIRYHAFEMPPGARVMIGRKKNDLIRQLRGPRVIVMHTRISLGERCLANVLPEFEVATPRVMAEGGGKAVDYLSLGVHDSGLTGYAPERVPCNLRRMPARRWLDLYRLGAPYIDGGVFMVRRDVHAACPLHDEVAWDEGEDLEWSHRLLAAGFLLDLAPDAAARSSVNNLRSTGLPAGAEWLARAAKFGAYAFGHRMRHHLDMLLGRR